MNFLNRLNIVLFTFAGCMGGITAASATELTPIEGATLICENHGAMYAFNILEKRVWISDPGETSGLELNINTFQTLRCPNCFNIEANLSLAGDVIEYDLSMRGVSGNFNKAKLNVWGSRAGSNQSPRQLVKDMICKRSYLYSR